MSLISTLLDRMRLRLRHPPVPEPALPSRSGPVAGDPEKPGVPEVPPPDDPAPPPPPREDSPPRDPVPEAPPPEVPVPEAPPPSSADRPPRHGIPARFRDAMAEMAADTHGFGGDAPPPEGIGDLLACRDAMATALPPPLLFVLLPADGQDPGLAACVDETDGALVEFRASRLGAVVRAWNRSLHPPP